MHKHRWNHLQLDLLLEPEGGLLIKAGSSPLDPTRPDMSFVRTTHPATGEETIYLPGSSLKGVLRSHAERLIRSALGEAACWTCDPLQSRGRDALCSSHWRTREARRMSAAQIYARSCLACRTFGHTRLASRLLAADAFPLRPVTRLPVRQGVSIDRKTGRSSGKALYDLEVAPTGTVFRVQLQMHNFELWQVGLLAQVLQEMDEGWVRVGYGKSRGLGRVRLVFTRLRLAYFAPSSADEAAWRGVAALALAASREPYRLLETGAEGPRPAVLSIKSQPDGHHLSPLGSIWRWGLEEPLLWGQEPASQPGLGAAHQTITAVLQRVQAAWANLVQSPPQAPATCGEEWLG